MRKKTKVAYEAGSEPFIDAVIEYMTGAGYSLTTAKRKGDGEFSTEFSTSDYAVDVEWYSVDSIDSFYAEPYNKDWPSIKVKYDYSLNRSIAYVYENNRILERVSYCAGRMFFLQVHHKELMDLLPELESMAPAVLDAMERFEADYNNLIELADTF